MASVILAACDRRGGNSGDCRDDRRRL